VPFVVVLCFACKVERWDSLVLFFVEASIFIGGVHFHLRGMSF